MEEKDSGGAGDIPEGDKVKSGKHDDMAEVPRECDDGTDREGDRYIRDR